MKRDTVIFIIVSLILIVLTAVGSFTLLPDLLAAYQSDQPAQTGSESYGSHAAQARVLEVIEEGTVTLGDVEQTYQVLRVVVLEGEYAGEEFEIEFGRRQIRPAGLNLSPGDRVILNVSQGPGGSVTARFLDFVRTRSLLILLATFVVFSIAISGWKGVRGLLGMVFSIAVILFYIIPQILAGKNPVLISVSGAFILLSVTLYLVYGWTLKTHAAVLGTLISLILTAFLADYFVDLTRLTGFGSEDALFLIQQSDVKLNMRGLVLGGMLIGALGVLDDLVITQASVVFELYGLNADLTWKELYSRAMRVGQDHVAATVNTLVLAYAGAALPMFLLFSLSGERITYLLNLEFVTEEIVRTMVGSLGLISAVPLTTLLSTLMVIHGGQWGPWSAWLGPVSVESDHDHTH